MAQGSLRSLSRGQRIGRTARTALSQWQLYVLILPAIVYLILFNYAPMYGLQIAFKNFRPSKGIMGSDWVGLDHFIKFINFPNFWQYLRNTAVLSLYSLATFPLAVILALQINELNSSRFKKTVQMITYAPHFISTVVMVSMITMFFSRSMGLVNNVIERLGGTRYAFLEDASLFPTIYVWSGVWQQTGWNTIIYLSALSGVSPDLVEAAKIDGANRFQIITHVNLPTILPTVIITLIMRCGSLFTVGFEKAYLMQNSLNLETSQIISTYVYEIGLQSGQFSYSSAIELFNTLINVLMLLCVNQICRRTADISLW